MRKVFMWLGIGLVVLGVLLPWLRIDTAMGSSSATGFQMNQGLISVALGVVSTVFGYFSSAARMPRGLGAGATVLTGLVVCVITGQALGDAKGTARSIGRFQALVAQNNRAFEAHNQHVRDKMASRVNGALPQVPALTPPSVAAGLRVQSGPGVFITFAGGLFLTLAGLLSFRREESR